MALEMSSSVEKEAKNFRYNPIETHPSGMAINLRKLDRETGHQEVRSRMIAEYNNIALVSTLLLTMAFPFLVGPPEFPDKDSLKFRVFMYAAAIAVTTLLLSSLVSVSLAYNLNMMPTEKELGEFIRKISQLGPGASPNGLPDYLIVCISIGGLNTLVMAVASIHNSMKPTDAWVITVILFTGVFFIAVLSGTVDQWKWKLIKDM
eukprot:CAMPEP_0114360514 /NCGR_PEP_ID=MMETSP0101-20121206/23928_1 /TAXON_ID=38822 ORGANISM="Pteridomonas danica, Strain PT" /NCGR_SAMPLE_ID=MMETSP0101 /ASSEMBLY_ACC=CAM_ASM_000211 /LENGTH=204 /DNA_ID=CAMNT_0001504803 /DNA_START=6 /DNA_END=620 /DNA_ORIENTATION=+